MRFPARPAADSLWRPGRRRLAQLVAGLLVFGAGEGLVVVAAFGNSPWTVFAEGIASQTPLSIGAATVVVSFVLLLLFIPLRVRVGLGTVLNAVLVGLALDATVALLGPSPLPVRVAELLGGVALIGLASGLYLGTALGPGPRDGLMTGLHERTGRPLGWIRAGIELSALAGGVLLGGSAGIGTVVFAVLIGPAVATGVRLIPGRRGSELSRP